MCLMCIFDNLFTFELTNRDGRQCLSHIPHIRGKSLKLHSINTKTNVANTKKITK